MSTRQTRTLISILFIVLAVLSISNCATTPKTQEERESVKPEIFFKSIEMIGERLDKVAEY